MTKLQLHWQILIAIAAAVVIGSLINGANSEGMAIGGYAQATFDFVGTMFLNGLKMIIVPLILSSIICGVASMGNSDNLGRMGGKTIGFYMLSSLFAILVGLLVVNIISPGTVDGEPARELLNLSNNEETKTALEKVEGRDAGDIAEVFHRMLPPNLVKAAAENQMLGLICFGLLFGFFMLRIDGKLQQTLLNFWQGVFETMMGITMFIMKFAPIGVFGLVANTIAATGFSSFLPLLKFFIAVIIALSLHVFVTMTLILKYVARINPLKLYRAMSPALLTAFSTASSSGTLPVTMKSMEENAGVSKKTTSFVLPLGATINMDGTALYECVAAMFIAQAYGLDLSITTQFTIVLTALLTSVGVAGIPSASLVAITIILTTIGLPAEGIALLLVTDRILDMLRTAVNVFSDSCCTTVIARSEGEETHLQ